MLIGGDDEVAGLGALVAFTGVGVVADVAADDGGAGLVGEDVGCEGEGESEGE